MKIAVIGAGIVGVATAWELVADGHHVTVFERHGSVAEEASFANAGVVAPGYVTPWASPGMPGKVLAQLWSRHAAVRLRPRALLQAPWIWRFLLASRRRLHEANREAMRGLALYSRSRMQELASALGLGFEQAHGYLVLARSAAELSRLAQGTSSLRDVGIRAEVLDARGCRVIEPGLRQDTELAGGVHLEGDFVGNCRSFAQALRAKAQEGGAVFHFGSEVVRVQSGEAVRVVWRPASSETGSAPEPNASLTLSGDLDAVVICAGVGSNRLLHGLGLRLPLTPVYGYSMTAPLRADGHTLLDAPRSGIMDERYKVAISRLGQHVRVAGSAELGGHPTRMNVAAQRTLYKVLEDWFPGVCELSRTRHWKGARPMLPDGPPLIGRSTLPGIWLNLGHGSSGWALSCGSARVLRDQIVGRAPEIDVHRLSLTRLGVAVPRA